MARSAKNTAWNEVFALVLLGVGTLLFLALISYSPKDLPAWVWFSKVSTPNSPAQNFIGPLGAIVAGFCYFIDWRGVLFAGGCPARIRRARNCFMRSLRVSKRAVWIALFIVSGACLLHLQTQFLRDWHSAFNIQGPGGWVGYYFGRHVFSRLMGRVGSMILLSGLYRDEFHPDDRTASDSHRAADRCGIRAGDARIFTNGICNEACAAADLKGQLEISQRELAKQQRSIEKQLKRKGAPVAEPSAAFMSPEELAEPTETESCRYHGACRRTAGARKKPSLAELRGKEKRRKPLDGLTSHDVGRGELLAPRT